MSVEDDILESDRIQVMLYWIERDLVEPNSVEYKSYVNTGTLPGGQDSADRLARHFARYRRELTAQLEREVERYQDMVGDARVALEHTGIFHATGSIADGITKLGEQVERWLCCGLKKTARGPLETGDEAATAHAKICVFRPVPP